MENRPRVTNHITFTENQKKAIRLALAHTRVSQRLTNMVDGTDYYVQMVRDYGFGRPNMAIVQYLSIDEKRGLGVVFYLDTNEVVDVRGGL